MQPITYSVSKGLRAGAIAGFVGSIVLGIFGEIGAVAMNQELYYTTVARRMGFGDSSVLGGWTLHFIVGIVAGSIFIGATAAIRRFSLTTTKKAICRDRDCVPLYSAPNGQDENNRLVKSQSNMRHFAVAGLSLR